MAMVASREWVYAATAPIHDVLVPNTLFELGIGNLIFSRKLPNGNFAVTAFLVDTFCLGVKDAFYAIISSVKYEEYIRARLESGFAGRMQAQPPEYVRKLVEDAVAYARELGFDPHPDYKIARQIFGDVEAAACLVHFKFGRAMANHSIATGRAIRLPCSAAFSHSFSASVAMTALSTTSWSSFVGWVSVV